MKRTLLALWMLLAVSAFAGNVRLAWDANLQTIDGYKIYYKLQGETSWRPVITVPTGTTTYTITGLDPGMWVFEITAYKGAVESAHSYSITGQVVLNFPGGFRVAQEQ
jgi:hypothetical protein